jgi:hypothetical protein
LQRYDLRAIARSGSVFRFVLASPEPSLDVDLASLGKQALAVVRKLPEGDHAMPFGALLALAVSILESRLGCDGQIGSVESTALDNKECVSSNFRSTCGIKVNLTRLDYI